MARVLVPTIRAKVDPNPRGSATAHVTMSEDNPFKRNATSIREANQPVMHQMLPGMGYLGEEATSSTSSNTWGDMLKKLTGSLITEVGIPAIQQEVIKQPQQQLTAPGASQIPSTGSRQLPYTPTQQMPQGQYQPPMPQGNGAANMMPWVIGGLGALVVGGILFAKMGKKGGGRRRRR